MNLIANLVIVIVSLVSALASSHDSSSSSRNRHVRRLFDYSSTKNITARDEIKALQRRFGPNARFSWYHPGLGACGKTNGPNDFIVALTQEQFGNGEHCFEPITITYKGKSAQATIVDECMECPYAALDFSPGLFNFFGSTADGYLYGSWEFGSGQDSKPKTTSTPPPKPTTTEKVIPTSTWTPEPTTSSTPSEKASTSTFTTSTHTSTASSLTVSKKASSSVTSSTLTSTSSMSVTPSKTAFAIPTDNFGQLDLVMADLGAILVGGVLVGTDGQ